MNRTKIIKCLITIFAISFLVFSAQAVFAKGGAGEGEGATGGGCNGYWSTCHGYTWQGYKVKKDLPSDDSVHFHYSSHVPMVALHYCKKGQYLYNYGYDTYSPLGSGYQVGTVYDKDGVQAVNSFGDNWTMDGALGAYPGSNNTTGDYLESAGKYLNPGIVALRFLQMQQYDQDNEIKHKKDSSHPLTNYTHGTDWDNVGWFCFDEDIIKTPNKYEFTSRSGVTATVKSTGQKLFEKLSEVDNRTNDKTSDDVTRSTYVITSPVAGKVKLTFNHRLRIPAESEIRKANASTTFSILQKSSISGQNNKYISQNKVTKLKNKDSSNNYVWVETSDGKYYRRIFENSLEVDVPANGSVWVCQQIDYSPKDFIISNGSFSSDGGKGGSKMCIQLKHGTGGTTTFGCTEPPCVPPPITGNSDANYGNTEAESFVRNFNRDGDWQTTTYAKPGDEIRFGHTYWFGVQAVTSIKGSEVDESDRNGDLANYRKVQVPQSWFYITAQRNGSNNSRYLFDHTDLGSQITLTSAQGSPSQLNGKRDDDGDTPYAATFMLPRNSANYGFSCSRFGSTDQPYTFQVPGFASNNNNCKAQTAVASNSDVGVDISQTFHYNDVDAWIGYRTHRSGSCGCDDNSASGSGEQQVIDHYPLSGNHEFGRTVYNCKQYSTCKCRCRPCHCDASGCDSCCSTCTSYSTRDDYVDYPLSANTNNNASTSANVKIPYNFDTETSSRISSNMLYAGEDVTSSFVVTVKERLNSLVSGESYMTITPSDTEIQAVAFTLNPNVSVGTASSIVGGGISNAYEDPCSYYRRRFGTSSGIICNLLDSRGGSLNGDGQLDGEVTGYNRTIYDIVPDVEVGSKYCVAVGVSHADSHGYPDQSLSTSEGANGTSMGNTNPSWRISNASCRTITKKPNFQAWGGVYSQGNIRTTISKKHVNASTSSDGTEKIFGSFVDTFVIGRQLVTGFSSGAGLGYIGNQGGADSSKYYCQLINMSISNSACNNIVQISGSAGNISVSTSDLLAQILSRYTPTTKTPQPGSSVIYRPTQTLNGGAQYTYVEGNANLGGVLAQGTGTRIIEVNGTLTIDHNICSGSGNCQTETNRLALVERNNQAYANIADIPQVIIIAKNINVTDNVTQVDAWLIVNNGTVNTCTSGHPNANTCNKTIIFNGPIFAKDLILNRTAGAYPGDNRVGAAKAADDLASANRGVNGSGYATYPGYGSLTPAEIFNLRPDVYYWAQNQANRLTQATVVYMRELAPRY